MSVEGVPGVEALVGGGGCWGGEWVEVLEAEGVLGVG